MSFEEQSERPNPADHTVGNLMGVIVAADGMIASTGRSEVVAGSVLEHLLTRAQSWNEEGGLSAAILREYAARLAVNAGLQIMPQEGEVS